jgi:hypothetical protein
MNNDCLAIEISINQNKTNLEKLKRIINIMLRIEQF